MTGKRILIIDDEPDVVRVVQARLTAAGYQSLAAFDGQEGYDKARQEKPDLIILDLMLPKLNGYQVCRLLKSDEDCKQIPIIIFTARAQESDIKTGLEVGADAYLTKPYNPEVLLSKVKELIK